MKNDTKIDTRGSPKTRKAALEAAFAKFNCEPYGTKLEPLFSGFKAAK